MIEALISELLDAEVPRGYHHYLKEVAFWRDWCSLRDGRRYHFSDGSFLTYFLDDRHSIWENEPNDD